MLTELVNIGLHGFASPGAVFTFGGTFVSAAMIFGVVPVQGLISKSLAQLKDLRNKEVA